MITGDNDPGITPGGVLSCGVTDVPSSYTLADTGELANYVTWLRIGVTRSLTGVIFSLTG